MSRTIRIKAQYLNNTKACVKWIDKQYYDTTPSGYTFPIHISLANELKAQIGYKDIKPKIMVYLYKSGSNREIDYDYKFIRTKYDLMDSHELFDKIRTFFQ